MRYGRRRIHGGFQGTCQGLLPVGDDAHPSRQAFRRAARQGLWSGEEATPSGGRGRPVSAAGSGSLGHIRKVPGIRLERGKPPGDPGCVAPFVALSVDPGCLELTADRGAPLIDSATDVLPDGPFQGHAPGLAPLGPDHHPPVLIELPGQMDRNPSGCFVIRFCPVKRCPIIRTTRPTRKTRIGSFHSCLSLQAARPIKANPFTQGPSIRPVTGATGICRHFRAAQTFAADYMGRLRRKSTENQDGRRWFTRG